MTEAATPRSRLTKTSLVAGIWEGVLSGTVEGTPPAIAVTLQARPVEGVELAPADAGGWTLRVPVPPAAISDGLHSFVVSDAASGEVLGSFAILAGEALAEDIRAELDLLRAELDLLKRAFRRHCVDTGG